MDNGKPTRFKSRWLPLNGGRLTLCHRPGSALLAELCSLGCSRVVTLLSEREGGLSIGHMTQNRGMIWDWVPLENGRPPVGQAEQTLLEAIPRLAASLQSGESIMIHCAAGIHRTGMLAYALLRYLGYGPEAALDSLGMMRPHTLAGIQARQIEWGDRVVEQGRIPVPETNSPSSTANAQPES